MPIYEFHCKTCRTEFKTLRRSENLAEVACPECGTTKVARLLSVTAATSNDAPAPMSCAGPMPSGGCCMGAMGGCGRAN